jgi:hypothetical protein
MPLSQGHAQLAEENAQDLKEASGVNPDLLATDSKSQSGRAILLKQRQDGSGPGRRGGDQ